MFSDIFSKTDRVRGLPYANLCDYFFFINKKSEKRNFALTRVLLCDIMERARLEKLEAELLRSVDILEKRETVEPLNDGPTEPDIHAFRVCGVMDRLSF